MPEVAEVIRGESSRGARQAIADAIRRGTILPGLRKTLGRWRVPLPTLAEWLDSLTTPPEEAPAVRVIHHIKHDKADAQPARHKGRVVDAVRKRQKREEQQQARAADFFQTVRAFMDAKHWGGVGRSRRPRGGKPV